MRIKSERMMFVRGEHWLIASPKWNAISATLRKRHRPQIARSYWHGPVKPRRRNRSRTPCDSTPLWEGKHSACSWLGQGFSTTRLLGLRRSRFAARKPWAADAFTPMKFPYREGIWRGPLIVVVDSGTGSASEEFAATLQDNLAALIVGESTVGAGCGHTDGGTPTTLKNSLAVLEVPDWRALSAPMAPTKYAASAPMCLSAGARGTTPAGAPKTLSTRSPASSKQPKATGKRLPDDPSQIMTRASFSLTVHSRLP